jgi:hypothetical protein
VLGAVAWAMALRKERYVDKRTIPWLLMILAMAFFALGTRIRVGGPTCLDLRELYRPLRPLVATFRTSGRFVWLLHYLVTIVGMAAVLRWLRGRPRTVTAILAGALALQALELRPRSAHAYLTKTWSPLQSRAWSLVGPPYRHLAVFPAMVRGAGRRYDEDLVTHLALRAYLAGMTYNSGHVGRGSWDMIRAQIQLRADVARGQFEPNTVYVARMAERPAFDKALCGNIEGLLVCVDPANTGGLADYLAAQDAKPRP